MLEVIGSATITIVLLAEFIAAIGIAVVIYQIYNVRRQFNVPQPSYNTWNTYNYHGEPEDSSGLEYDVDTHDELSHESGEGGDDGDCQGTGVVE
jgi:hypothetical protein